MLDSQIVMQGRKGFPRMSKGIDCHGNPVRLPVHVPHTLMNASQHPVGLTFFQQIQGFGIPFLGFLEVFQFHMKIGQFLDGVGLSNI